tara:strand:- start:4995 stop:5327 length:333 start_codon:yes stop_codon:yes gene_type:complete
MKWNVTVIVLFVWAANFAQIKDGISVVQYTASFAEQVELKSFRDHNIQTLFISKSKDIFEKENIKYLPTIILYSDGEVIFKVESGISLKLPENWKQQIDEHIDLLLEQRF